MLFAGAAAAMVISISTGISIYLADGWPQRLPPDVRKLAMAAFDGRAARSECHQKSPAEVRAGQVCETGDTTADAPSFALGVQWHAEYDPQRNPINRALFRAFGEALLARKRPA